MKKTILSLGFIVSVIFVIFLLTPINADTYVSLGKKNTILELNNTPKGTVAALYTDQSTSEQQTPPSLEQKLGQFDPTYIDKITFTVDFREPIDSTTFTAGDITLAGTTGTVTSLEMVSPLNENRVFEFTVTGMTAGDTVTASLAANMVEYPNGDSNIAATSIDATVHYMEPINCGALGLGEVITNRLNNDINLLDGNEYGSSIANMGDLNGDGITDIAVGVKSDDTGGNNRGAVYIHFMNSDGSVNKTRKITSDTDNGPNLSNDDGYGSYIANIGDLDGDGIVDIAVGSSDDDTGGFNSGAVYIHFMNSDGIVKVNGTRKISHGTLNGPTLSNMDAYGSSIANIGDLDGDGIVDIAVGARMDNIGVGNVYIHFMNSDGTVKQTKEINNDTPNGPTLSNGDRYGYSIANIGDLNGDGITDIAVGAAFDDTGGGRGDRGAVYIHFMNIDGSVKENGTRKITSGSTNVPTFAYWDLYGSFIANIGDINGDGITDIAVGAVFDDVEGHDSGAVYIHFMNRDGGVKKTFKIDNRTLDINFPYRARYGRAIINMGDPDGNGTITIAVAARDIDSRKGAVYFSKIQFVCSPSLEQKLGQFDPTYIDKATFTVDFRKPINPNTFIVDDITLTGTTVQVQ